MTDLRHLVVATLLLSASPAFAPASAAHAAAATAGKQSAQDSWSRSDCFPAGTYGAGVVETGNPDKLIVSLPPNYVFEYTISTGAWRDLGHPGNPGAGRNLTYMAATNQVFAIAGTQEVHRYDIATNGWQGLTPLIYDSGPTPYNPVCLVAAGNKVYALSQPASFNTPVRNRFYVLDPGVLNTPNGTLMGRWSARADSPFDIHDGAAMVWDGADTLYAIFGGWAHDGATQCAKFLRYSISGDAWENDLNDLPEPSVMGNSLAMDRTAKMIYFACGHLSRYSIASGLWTMDAAPLPIITAPALAPAGGMACVADGGTLFIADDIRLNRYSVSARAFVAGADETIATPGPAAMVTAGGDGESLYLLSEGGSGTFRRYSIVTREWESLPPAPAGFLFTSLVHSGGDFIYAVFGYMVARYSITAKEWVFSPNAEATVPSAPWGATAVCRGPGRSILAIEPASFQAPNPNGRIHRLDDGAAAWTLVTAAPDEVILSTAGGSNPALSMTWDGGDRLYLFGLRKMGPYWNEPEFFCYSLAGQTWNPVTPQACPAKIGSKATLQYLGSQGRIFAFSGGIARTPDSGRRFWSYDTDANAWTECAPAPFWNGADNGGNNTIAYPGRGSCAYAVPFGVSVMHRYQFVPNLRPTLGAVLTQQRDDGSAIGSTPIDLRHDLLLGATPADADADLVCIEVELKMAGASYDDVSPAPGIRSALAVAGAAHSVRIPASSLVVDTAYKWRVRSVDEHNGTSAWSYPAEPAFSVTSQSAPDVIACGQFDLSGRTVEAAAGVFDTVVFKATCIDAQGDAYTFSVELRPVGEAFRGVATEPRAAAPSGASVEISAPLRRGQYTWQYKVDDEYGYSTGWIRQGEFEVQAYGSSAASNGCPLSSQSRAAGLAGFMCVLGLISRRMR